VNCCWYLEVAWLAFVAEYCCDPSLCCPTAAALACQREQFTHKCCCCCCCSPLHVSTHTQASVGETSIDPSAIVLRRSIELTNVPVGTARVVFNRIDFGNFLVHPLMTAAAAAAVQVGEEGGWMGKWRPLGGR